MYLAWARLGAICLAIAGRAVRGSHLRNAAIRLRSRVGKAANQGHPKRDLASQARTVAADSSST